MSWENILKEQTNYLLTGDVEHAAAQKVSDRDRVVTMDLSDIYFLSKFLKESDKQDIIINAAKEFGDENWQQGADMIALGERLEKMHDDLENALIKASELLKDIGL